MNPENNIKRNFLCWLLGHKGLPTCKRCWAIIDMQYSDFFITPPKEANLDKGEKNE